MLRNFVLSALAVCISASGAFASPTCTKEPEDKWLSEAAMKQKIAEMGYKDIKVFKKTTTGCYEIYGYTDDGRKAEVYFHPVTGAPSRKTWTEPCPRSPKLRRRNMRRAPTRPYRCGIRWCGFSTGPWCSACSKQSSAGRERLPSLRGLCCRRCALHTHRVGLRRQRACALFRLCHLAARGGVPSPRRYGAPRSSIRRAQSGGRGDDWRS